MEPIPVVDQIRAVHVYAPRLLRFLIAFVLYLLILYLFGGSNKPEARELSWSGDIHPPRVRWARQIEGLANFATVHLRIRPPGFFDATALPLKNVSGVKPAFEVSTADLAFVVLFIACTLTGLFYLNFVLRKLLNRVRCVVRHLLGRHRTIFYSSA